jgi:subtilase family serine protease
MRRTLRPIVAAIFALLTCAATAQGPLITTSLNENRRFVLHGNLPSMAQAGNDLGAAPDNEHTGTLYLVLGRSEQQQRDLAKFAAQASQPGTAQYRHWLTPDQYGAKFGIFDSDLDQVVSWMQTSGLTAERVPAARNVIRFSGTMGALRTAFHTEIHRYAIGDRIRLSTTRSHPSPGHWRRWCAVSPG